MHEKKHVLVFHFRDQVLVTVETHSVTTFELDRISHQLQTNDTVQIWRDFLYHFDVITLREESHDGLRSNAARFYYQKILDFLYLQKIITFFLQPYKNM